MLFLCEWTWQAHTTAPEVRKVFLQQHDAGLHRQDRWRGWYTLAGGGAGFVLIDVDDPRELTPILQPYMGLVSWDVRAVFESDYDQAVERFRQSIQQGT